MLPNAVVDLTVAIVIFCLWCLINHGDLLKQPYREMANTSLAIVAIVFFISILLSSIPWHLL